MSTRRQVVATTVVLAVVGLLAWQPSLTAILGLVSLGALLGSVAFPKSTIFLAVTVVLTTKSLVRLTGVGALDGLDDLAVAAAVFGPTAARIVARQAIRVLPGLPWLVLFVVAGMLGAVRHAVPLAVAAPSLLSFLKGFALCFGTAQCDWRPEDAPRLIRSGAGLIAVLAATCAANLAAPTTWAAHLSNSGLVRTRLNLPSLIGPFVHPNELGQVASLMALAALAVAWTRGARSAKVIAAGMAVLSALSLRRKAVVGMLAGAGALRVLVARDKAVGVLAVLSIGAAGAALLLSPLERLANTTRTEYIASAERAPRTAMYQDSAAIALRDFPLGAGFGRFGSRSAAVHYSPEYERLGYPAIWGLQPGGNYLTDTSWPAVLGESGTLGLLGYLGALGALVRVAWRHLHVALPLDLRWLPLTATAWIIEYAVESVAAPSFTAPPSYALFFAAMGVLAGLQRWPRPQDATPVSITTGALSWI